MPEGYENLTDKEKEALRLLLRGHDAKSMARTLDLSVHTINDRLRTARRKLSVTSSKQAARLLLTVEGAPPDNLADEDLGGADLAGPADVSVQPQGPQPAVQGRRRTLAWSIGVMIMFSTLLALAVAGALPGNGPAADTAAAQESNRAAENAARDWLELGDAEDWATSYAGTAAAFRAANTLQVWTDISRKVRVPLGQAVSRRLRSVDAPPTPQDYRIVTFETNFGNSADAKVETLSMIREDGAWKVAGIYIE